MFSLARKNWFTLVEIMLVIAMIGILFAWAFYMWWPYLSRSRDVSRFADLQQYSRVLDLYYKDYQTLPSNSIITPIWAIDYCADWVFFEWPNSGDDTERQFEELRWLMANSPMRDPVKSSDPIGPCSRSGSYLYSKIVIPWDGEYSLLWTRMNIVSNGNYMTGSDISSTWQVSPANLALMQASYKWTITDTTEWSMYYFVATKH